MRIKEIEAQNFKGIEKINLSLESSPRNNVFTLVGINESGKTTILEAMNSFEYNEEKQLSTISNAIIPIPEEIIPVKDRTNFNGSIKIITTLLLEESDKVELKEFLENNCNFILCENVDEIKIEQLYNYKNSKYEGTTQKWDLKLIGKPKGSRSKKLAELGEEEWKKAVDMLKTKMPKLLYFPSALFDLPDKIYLDPIPENDYKNKFYSLVVQDVLDSLGGSLNIKEHLIDRIKSEDKSDRDNLKQVCLMMGRKLSQVILEEWSMVLTNKAKGISVEIDKDQTGVFIEFKIEGDDGYFHLSERSQGFRWFFVFLLLTQFRGYRKNEDKHIIFLFDEPAANLSQKAQKQLIKNLETISDKCTIIYTTHSQHLINPNWLEGAYIVTNDAYDGGEEDYEAKNTNIRLYRYRQFVDQYPQRVSYFQPILDVLEYVPNELDMCDNAIIVEGKTDYYVLNYFFKVILKREDLHLIPGMSCNNADTLISLYNGWGKNFIVLLDSDDAGKTSKKRYEDQFGSIVEGKIITLNDIDSSWKKKNMESILDNKIKLFIEKSCFPDKQKYTKNLYNKAIQELLMCNKEINLPDDVKKSFEKIYDYLNNYYN
ncbi:MAG: AAA family ATPase [Bacilli bacterium]|nr:AAA family ATPase [Bacilli bacterium]